MTPLAQLFPDGDYRFHLTLRRGEPREFFQSQDSSGRMLAARAHWLAAEPSRYAALLPEGEPLAEEFATLMAKGNGAASAGERSRPPPAGARGYQGLIALGRSLEPDLLFLSADSEGQFRLLGGVLCFPTGWALEDKIGHPLDFIHGVVPGLNASLADPIRQFLAKLKPGIAFLRDNWGLTATDELNLHPSRHIPAPLPPAALDRLWLRVEHQALLALPETRGIVFGIRIALHRLDDVARGAARVGLRRALETMPAEMAAYKRIAAIREQVIRLL